MDHTTHEHDIAEAGRQWQAIHTEILSAAKTLQDDTVEAVPTKLISRPSGTVLLQESVYLITAE